MGVIAEYANIVVNDPDLMIVLGIGAVLLVLLAASAIYDNIRRPRSSDSVDEKTLYRIRSRK